ncbi:MAG: hypothetical protein S4CHLAM7_13430 [Chlamydiae bacterium]|nr:hypothetical protein [Chlamydiota bacterium]
MTISSNLFTNFNNHFPNADKLHSFDLHYALAPVEKPEDSKITLFADKISKYIADCGSVEPTEKELDTGIYAMSPWSAPQMGWDIVPNSGHLKSEFVQEVLKIADFAKEMYIKLDLKGSLLFHPNTKPKDTDFVEEQADHLKRAWTVAGNEHEFKNVWDELITYSEYAKNNTENYTYDEMLAHLMQYRSERLSRLIIKNFNPQLHATSL